MDKFEAKSQRDEPERYALVGVRACALAAIGVQGRVLVEGRVPIRSTRLAERVP